MQVTLLLRQMQRFVPSTGADKPMMMESLLLEMKAKVHADILEGATAETVSCTRLRKDTGRDKASEGRERGQTDETRKVDKPDLGVVQ